MGLWGDPSVAGGLGKYQKREGDEACIPTNGGFQHSLVEVKRLLELRGVGGPAFRYASQRMVKNVHPRQELPSQTPVDVSINYVIILPTVSCFVLVTRGF